MKQEDISKLIIEGVGGHDNIVELYHCMTRLRFIIKDDSKFNSSKLKAVPGVINTIKSGKEYQIIIGAEVDKYYNNLIAHGVKTSEGSSEITQHAQAKEPFSIKNVFKTGINTLVGIMAPIIPLIIAGGMVKVLLALLVIFGVSAESQSYQLLDMISDAPFYFLPFFIANSAANKFKTSSFMAMVMAGVLLHPIFIELVASGSDISLLGLPVYSVSYRSTVIPIILVVWIMSYVERVVERFTPNLIKTMLRPVLILLITAPIALIVIGPLGAYIGEGIYFIIERLNTYAPWTVPTIMGIFSPLLVMMGMHLSITPFAILSVSNLGYETLMGPGMLGSNIAQGGAALAVGLKSKNLAKKEIALSASITALSGITEPALYGVTLKYKRTLAIVMISGGIAGLYAGLTGVVRYAFASAGFLSLPVFIGDDPRNFINALITAIIALVLSFVLTYLFVKIDKEETLTTDKSEKKVKEEIKNVVDGIMVPLTEVNDEAFASGSMGSGIGICPREGKIYAPVNGRVSMIYPTGHAIGVVSNDGTEILIHIGIDTVKLGGTGFKLLVEKDETVKAGDQLVEVDLDYLKEKGFDDTVIVLVLNANKENVGVTDKKSLSSDDSILQITNNFGGDVV
ncbi:beta-glucoside-specific PTS transporter subunit IIABC [Amphibacillus cookii]|uniref:beta-glucoside-specific PTS transporter subunit IIABC n=1 Tax=Amphibacillus cookii TaxID=767787 RepID=UPI00195928EB|nr:beta-glucoside-specific PTS transporter subunit IIABC [Amphibacillus cookii]MBM7542028.1 PTS system beta-glucosides-specific IIC component [Amphibacillus cookii]